MGLCRISQQLERVPVARRSLGKSQGLGGLIDTV